MLRFTCIIGLLLFLLLCCIKVAPDKAIIIENNTMTIIDIHGKSIQFTGALKDSLLVILETNSILESVDAWAVIKKLDMPDKISDLPKPKGFEVDSTATIKDFSEYGRHYYDIFVGKSRHKKEQYLISIDPSIKVRIIGNYWDLSIRVNDDKTKILETWIYRNP